jgi:hypothetical protein
MLLKVVGIDLAALVVTSTNEIYELVEFGRDVFTFGERKSPDDVAV